MIDAPQTDAIYSTYEDQLEALATLFHARARLAANPNSRFSGMSSRDIQELLESQGPRSLGSDDARR